MASESRNSTEDPAVPPSNFVVVKVYDPKGDLTLHRLSSATSFTCGRCNKEKKAKLVAIYRNQWNDLRCNGCYGKLLSEHWTNRLDGINRSEGEWVSYWDGGYYWKAHISWKAKRVQQWCCVSKDLATGRRLSMMWLWCSECLWLGVVRRANNSLSQWRVLVIIKEGTLGNRHWSECEKCCLRLLKRSYVLAL